jgi:hypothetical protein
MKEFTTAVCGCGLIGHLELAKRDGKGRSSFGPKSESLPVVEAKSRRILSITRRYSL